MFYFSVILTSQIPVVKHNNSIIVVLFIFQAIFCLNYDIYQFILIFHRKKIALITEVNMNLKFQTIKIEGSIPDRVNPLP